MKRKKLLSMALALALSLSVFVGCGNQSSGSSESQVTPSTTSAVSGEGEREMVGNMYVTGFPLVKEQVTYKFLVCNDGDPNKMDFWNNYAELTNVKIDWQYYDYDTTVEKKNQMYTTGEYYDGVGTWCLSDSDILTYGGDVWVPVDEMIDKYAPNLTYALDNFPDARGTMTTPDGHIYGFPIMAAQPDCTWIMHINKTWLENLDLEVPTTLEEFENVLRAFKEKDANGNGDLNDEIPLSFYDGGSSGYIYGSMFGAWGVLDDKREHVMIKDGEVAFTPATEGYKEGIQWLNKLYKEKLIDAEAFTQDSIAYQSKGKSGSESSYGVYIDFNGINVVGEERYTNEYISLAPLKGPTGTQLWGQGDPSIFRNMFAISTAAENPEVLVRWLDGLFDAEMSYQVCYGELDTWTEKGSDGVYRYKPFPDGMTESDIRNNYAVCAMPYSIMSDFPMDLNSNQIIKTEADTRISPFVTKEPFPAVWRTAEQNEVLKVISPDIQKLADDKRVAWITGQADINKEWDNYLKDLERIRLSEYVDIYQVDVDAYFANLK